MFLKRKRLNNYESKASSDTSIRYKTDINGHIYMVKDFTPAENITYDKYETHSNKEKKYRSDIKNADYENASSVIKDKIYAIVKNLCRNSSAIVVSLYEGCFWAIKTRDFKSIIKDTSIRISFGAISGLSIIIILFSILASRPLVEKLKIAPSSHDEVSLLLSEYLEFDFTGVGSGEEISEDDLSTIIKETELESYEVGKGDTLDKIAKKFSISLGTLISYNNIEDVRRIREGSVLLIPDKDGVLYKVSSGETLDRVSKKFSIAVGRICDANNLESGNIIPGQKLFIPGAKLSDYDLRMATGDLFLYPTTGRFTSGFGYRSDPFTGMRRFHYGVDLANSMGTPIRASMDGTIILVDSRPSGYGNFVLVKHSNGYQTLYAHMNSIYVSKGQRVYRGKVIGAMGTTGRSTGSHLHFQIYKNGVPVNPMRYLK